MTKSTPPSPAVALRCLINFEGLEKVQEHIVRQLDASEKRGTLILDYMPRAGHIKQTSIDRCRPPRSQDFAVSVMRREGVFDLEWLAVAHQGRYLLLLVRQPGGSRPGCDAQWTVTDFGSDARALYARCVDHMDAEYRERLIAATRFVDRCDDVQKSLSAQLFQPSIADPVATWPVPERQVVGA